MHEVSTAAPTAKARSGRLLELGLYLFVACSYVINAMDRQVFANLSSYVKEDLNLSLAQSGFITTIFALGFGITGVCAGVLLDRYRRKTVLISGMVLYSVFTIVIPLSQGFWDITAYRVITGIGEAMQQTAIFTMVGVFFARRRNLALGGVNAAYGIGSFIGPILGIQLFLAGSEDWRLPLYVFGAIGLVYAAVLLIFLPTDFSEYGKETAATKSVANTTQPSTDGKFSWITRNLALVAIANILLGVVNYSYLGLYPTFLKDELGYAPEAAALCASMYGIGAFAGLLSGYLADRYGERRMILFAIVGAVVVGTLLFNVAQQQWQHIVLSLFFGMFVSGFLFVNVYALTQRVVDVQHIGKASGVASSAHYIGAGFSGAIFGALVQAVGWGVGGLVILVVVPVVAAICVAGIRLAARPPANAPA